MDILNRHHLSGTWPTGSRYVGRGTPFGNPFVIGEHGTRQEVIAAYRAMIEDKIARRDPVILTAMATLNEDSKLVCSCAPAPCHAEVIRDLWQSYFRNGIGSFLKEEEGYRFHPDGSLPENGEVFVFGANLAGRHGKGAALVAKHRYGAQIGIGEGYMGKAPAHCYAIPTKDGNLQTLPAHTIGEHVARFVKHMQANPSQRYFVTGIGCGLAGYKPEEVAPLFCKANPGQCSFPENWRPYLVKPRFSMIYAGIGSRKTPAGVLAKMTRVAKRLEERGYTLRSGGADGADTAFEAGCLHKEIFLPWDGFNGRKSSDGYIDSTSDEASQIASAVHPAFGKLSLAAQKLMARSSHQVLGKDLRSPVDFVLCWTPDGAETMAERSRDTGGTGQAIALANLWGIPVFNMARPDALDRLGALLAAQSV